MDELDQKIISELQVRGFQKSEILAAHFGVGSRTIRRRISVMKNKGIFKITDDSGSIWIYTRRGTPREGDKITVTGIIREGLEIVGNKIGGLILIEKKLPDEKDKKVTPATKTNSTE